MISLPSARSPSPGCTCASARATGNSAPGMSNGARSRTSSKPAPVTAGTTAGFLCPRCGAVYDHGGWLVCKGNRLQPIPGVPTSSLGGGGTL